MAFWKKGEDPWDIDPEKQKRKQTALTFENESESAMQTQGEQEEQGIFAELAGMFKKKPVQEEEALPEPCPWCGQNMVRHYLTGGRDHVVLSETKPGAFLGTTFMETTLISDEGGWGSYKSCWHCIPCHKLVVDVPEKKDPLAWDGNPPSPDTAEYESEGQENL